MSIAQRPSKTHHRNGSYWSRPHEHSATPEQAVGFPLCRKPFPLGRAAREYERPQASRCAGEPFFSVYPTKILGARGKRTEHNFRRTRLAQLFARFNFSRSPSPGEGDSQGLPTGTDPNPAISGVAEQNSPLFVYPKRRARNPRPAEPPPKKGQQCKQNKPL